MGIYIGDSEIKKIYIGEGSGDDYSAMQGPCDVGFHIPMPSERQAILDDLTALGYTTDAQKGLILSYYLKIPVAGSRDYTGTVSHDSNGYYRCCKSTNSNRVYRFGSTTGFFNYYKGYGFSIRPFKDVPVVPDSNRTVEQQGTGDAGIFSNATLGLVSISGDGTNWVTIADKNVGATQVFQYLSALTEDNCGKYFQRGNNNGFAWDGSVTTSSTQVDASSYGPGNYYNSSTFITQQSWDSSNNGNLWGGVTGITKGPNVREVYKGTTKIRPLKTYQEILDMATTEGKPRTSTIAELNTAPTGYYNLLNNGGYLTTNYIKYFNSQQLPGNYPTIDGITLVTSASSFYIAYSNGTWALGQDTTK